MRAWGVEGKSMGFIYKHTHYACWILNSQLLRWIQYINSLQTHKYSLSFFFLSLYCLFLLSVFLFYSFTSTILNKTKHTWYTTASIFFLLLLLLLVLLFLLLCHDHHHHKSIWGVIAMEQQCQEKKKKANFLFPHVLHIP